MALEQCDFVGELFVDRLEVMDLFVELFDVLIQGNRPAKSPTRSQR